MIWTPQFQNADEGPDEVILGITVIVHTYILITYLNLNDVYNCIVDTKLCVRLSPIIIDDC